MIYGNVLDTVVYELAKKKYNIRKYKIDDFENKKICHNVLAIIENNYNRMENITETKELSIKFDYMRGCENQVLELIKQAKSLIKQYNLFEEKDYKKIMDIINEYNI